MNEPPAPYVGVHYAPDTDRYFALVRVGDWLIRTSECLTAEGAAYLYDAEMRAYFPDEVLSGFIPLFDQNGRRQVV